MVFCIADNFLSAIVIPSRSVILLGTASIRVVASKTDCQDRGVILAMDNKVNRAFRVGVVGKNIPQQNISPGTFWAGDRECREK